MKTAYYTSREWYQIGEIFTVKVKGRTVKLRVIAVDIKEWGMINSYYVSRVRH